MSDPIGRLRALAGEADPQDDPMQSLRSLAHGTPTPRKPSVGDQVVGAGEQVLNIFRHPIDAAKGVLHGAVTSAKDTFAPVIGTREGSGFALGQKDLDQIEKASGHPLKKITKENTPDAITPDESLRGMLNTTANLALPLLPGGAAVRVGSNAALGALNDQDQPLRGALAGMAIGELLHIPSAVGKMADVSHGMIESGVQGVHETVGEVAPLWKDGRRPAYSLPVKDRPALEPGPTAETVSAGGESMSALDELLATRGYLEPRGRLEKAAEITRRAKETLPMSQRPPVELGPSAETVSVGELVKRRVGATSDIIPTKPIEAAADVLNTSGQQDATPEPVLSRLNFPVERADLETQTFGGRESPTLQPVVSSNGSFEARPGVLRKVNKELGPEPITDVPLASRAGGSADPVDVSQVKSFQGVQTPHGEPIAPPAAPRPSDILNVAKLNLEDKTAEQRVAHQLEQFRVQRDGQRQTFQEADVNRADIVNELTASDPKALAPADAKKLSGEELLARRDVVRQNDQLIGDLSKAIESKELSVADHEQAIQMMQKAVEHNDALLSDLVTGSSQKGRDLNLLRRLANRSLDSDVWHVQAKRMLGDRPLTDEISANIRRLSQAAIDACGGG